MKGECYHCGAEVNVATAVGIELNCITGLFRFEDEPPFPEDESQGAFMLGPGCARRYRKSGEREVENPWGVR